MQTMGITRQDFAPLRGTLKELGLSTGEISLYLASLESGPQSLARLAQRLGISRPNIYKLLRGLEAHELAVLPERKSSRRFSVLSPMHVVEALDKKRAKQAVEHAELLKVIPKLMTAYRRGDLPSSVRLYQGHNQYLDLFFKILDEASGNYCFFGSIDDFLKLVSLEDQSRFLHDRTRRGISARALVLPGPHATKITREDHLFRRETRILRNTQYFPASFHLYSDKVILWQPESSLAIRIEDDLVAQMIRSVFEILWELNRPVQ